MNHKKQNIQLCIIEINDIMKFYFSSSNLFAIFIPTI